MTENPPTTDMFFGDEDNPTMWFAEFQRMLPLSWVENEKVSHFVNHIVSNSYASDWIDTLTRNDMASLAAIRTAFNVRWPPPERPKFSRAEQMERIREQILREENVGKWVTPSDRRKADYGQNMGKRSSEGGDNHGRYGGIPYRMRRRRDSQHTQGPPLMPIRNMGGI
jgi:hypothetical protein